MSGAIILETYNVFNTAYLNKMQEDKRMPAFQQNSLIRRFYRESREQLRDEAKVSVHGGQNIQS